MASGSVLGSRQIEDALALGIWNAPRSEKAQLRCTWAHDYWESILMIAHRFAETKTGSVDIEAATTTRKHIFTRSFSSCLFATGERIELT